MTAIPSKPKALAVIPEAIPLELKAIPQWVVWKYVPGIDKETGETHWDKPPMDAKTGKAASSTGKGTWCGYATAMAAYQKGRLDGLGFVLFRDPAETGPGLVGLDLDKCRDPATGQVDQWALDIVLALDSYTEVSPSGKGIRIFCKGILPPSGRKRGKFECYQTGRYVTVTGHRIHLTHCEIRADRQEQLIQVHRQFWPEEEKPRPSSGGNAKPTNLSDLEVIERAGRAKTGPKFLALWKGDTGGYSSPSEADLALCNYLAFWCGPNGQARVDDLFSQSGLFRAKWKREDYVKRTIAKAYEGRTEFYDSRNGCHKQPGTGGAGRRPEAGARPEQKENRFSNFFEVETEIDGKTEMVKVGYSAQKIWDDLQQITGNWPRRVGKTVFAIQDYKPVWLESADALFAWINKQVSGSDANDVRWVGGQDKLCQAQFYHFVQQQAQNYDGLEFFPHYPELPRVFYCHPQLQGGGGQALAWLVNRFAPAIDIDRDLIKAMFLTLGWGGAPGKRPAMLIEAETDDKRGGRGVGKTKLAQAAAAVVGGHVDIRPREDIDKLCTRLLSADAMDRRCVLLDNIKESKLSSADLESLVTNDVISGRKLYTGEGRRLNTLVWFLTVNYASVSKDMAQRCVPIRLARPQNDPDWETRTFDFIEEKRWEILGDIIAILQEQKPRLEKYSRWSAWEQEVLAHVACPSECQAVIADRQGMIDGDNEEMELVRDELIRLLKAHGHHPENDAVWIPSKDAAQAVSEATGDKYTTTRTKRHLRVLGIPGLTCPTNGHGIFGRGFGWRGKETTPETPYVRLE